jgi:hypothetical protein
MLSCKHAGSDLTRINLRHSLSNTPKQHEMLHYAVLHCCKTHPAMQLALSVQNWCSINELGLHAGSSNEKIQG